MRKGAIELSLGFIVTVVFAVILLSLAIVWLRGTIINVSTLTDDQLQRAEEELRSVFDEGTKNYDVKPSNYELDAGTKLLFKGGVKNNDKDAKEHNFVFNVFPASASRFIVDNYGCSDFSACSELQSDMLSWLTYNSGPYSIAAGNYRTYDVSLEIPTDAVKGTYQYDAVVCEDMTMSECDIETTNWGSAVTLTYTIK